MPQHRFQIQQTLLVENRAGFTPPPPLYGIISTFHITTISYVGQSNLAKDDIADTYDRNLVDIFCYICQVAGSVAKLVLRGAFETPFGRKGKSYGGRRWYHSKQRWWFPIYRLSIVTTALSLTIRPQFAIECLRRSNQQGVGHFGEEFREEAVDQCKPNFNAIKQRHGAAVRKWNPIDILGHLSTMHERGRQTEKQTTER